ncbi:MAG: helix-turn-helix transcriptional regulator [Clostridia bacterium]|nr:helix-turn-helix transcriptional regulator [Clostridia bacterium]
MKLTIGEKIKELRKRDGRKQEDLANVLGVTNQAVSRWEKDGSYPDVEMIPAIANYFGVTIDELFGYENGREKQVDELVSRLSAMNKLNNGENVNIDECLHLARTALAEFPGNTKILLCLAWLLTTAGYVKYSEYHVTDSEGYDTFDVKRHKTYKEWAEAIAIYEKLLPTLENGSARNDAVKQLSNLYLCTGELGKAAALAENAPDIHCSKEFLQMASCDGKERAAKYGETALKLLGIAAELIGDAVAANYDKLPPETAETYIKNAADLFGAVCIDGNYGEYGINSAYLYLYLSSLQWRSGKRKSAVDSLYKALEHTKKCEEISLDTTRTFSSPLLKNVKINPLGSDYRKHATKLPEYWPWICIPNSADVAKEMQSDPRYKEWVAKTQE